MTLCHNLPGAYQHPDVRIGWAPYVCVDHTEIMTNPIWGKVRKIVPRGGGVAYQSARNPTGSKTPPLREPRIIDGIKYVWVYSRAGCIQGWVRRDQIQPDPDSLLKPALLGPAGYDFEIGRTDPLPKKPSGCGRLSTTKPIKTVSVTDTYLRYSPRGTAFHFLHKGDKIQLFIVDGPHGFAFGEVVEVKPGSAARVGSKGWILHESLS